MPKYYNIYTLKDTDKFGIQTLLIQIKIIQELLSLFITTDIPQKSPLFTSNRMYVIQELRRVTKGLYFYDMFWQRDLSYVLATCEYNCEPD